MPRLSTRRVRRARKGAGALTLDDVARVAGVSPITISRALNYPHQLSADMLSRVQEAVARTGYIPNRIAGGLASSRSRVVAAKVPTIPIAGVLGDMRALTEAWREGGCQVMLGQSGCDVTREDALLDAIISRRPDGVVLTGVVQSRSGRQRLASAGLPV